MIHGRFADAQSDFCTRKAGRETATAGREERDVLPVASLCGLTVVAVMQTADFRRHHDHTGAQRRRRAIRGILPQGEVRAAAMVVDEIRSKDAAEMLVIEDDHVVQAVAPNGADQALDIGILPRSERT
jgi:hypothetical protein